MGSQVIEAHQLNDYPISVSDKDRWGHVTKHMSFNSGHKTIQIIEALERHLNFDSCTLALTALKTSPLHHSRHASLLTN